MRQFTAMVLALSFVASAPAYAQSMEVSVNGSRPASKGAAENFTGSVVVEPLFAARIDAGQQREAGMAKDLKKGDKVSWETSQGKTHGVVEKKQMSETRIRGQGGGVEGEPGVYPQERQVGKKGLTSPRR